MATPPPTDRRPTPASPGAPATRPAPATAVRPRPHQAPPAGTAPTHPGPPGRLRRHRLAGRPGRPAGAQPGGRGDRPAGRRRRPVGRRPDLPAGDRAGRPGRAPAGLRRRLGHRAHRARPGRPADGPARPARLRPALRRGDARPRTCSTTSWSTSTACRSSGPPTSTWPRCSAGSGWSAWTSRPPTLLRRLGPRRWRPRPTPDRVIDWAAIQPFGERRRRTAPRCGCGRPTRGSSASAPASWPTCSRTCGGTSARSCWPRSTPEEAADALEEMEPEELDALLREAEPGRGGRAARRHGARRGGRRAARPHRARSGPRSCGRDARGDGGPAASSCSGYPRGRGRRVHDHHPGHGRTSGDRSPTWPTGWPRHASPRRRPRRRGRGRRRGPAGRRPAAARPAARPAADARRPDVGAAARTRTR